MIRIGLTGGIGSGKSTIGRIFSALGIPLYEADKRAKELNESDIRIKNGLIALLGNEVYMPDGHLNKPYMASQIFTDKALLSQVNALIHPIVFEDFDNWCEQQQSNNADIVVCEAAVMVENGFHSIMDKIIVVTLDRETRIKRTMLRDKASYEQVESRINNQLSDDEMLKVADFTITPDDHQPVLQNIINIINSLRNKQTKS